MGKNVDEDLIEATIRRVAEAQAARGGTGEDEAPPDRDDPDAEAQAEPEPSGAAARAVPSNEGLIEATIRRVAEAKAAQTRAAARLAHDRAPREVEAAAHDTTVASAPAPDEEIIEATIRRVAEAKAAQTKAASRLPDPEAHPAEIDEPPPHDTPAAAAPAPNEAAIEATIRRVTAAKAARTAEPVPAVAAPSKGPQVDEAAWLQATERIERKLTDTWQALQALSERIDALAPLLERNVAAQQPHKPAQSGAYRGHLAVAEADDEWDEQPQPARMAVGLPPRPAIFRDPAPRPPEQEDIAPQSIAARAPAPPPAETRRGLELLPHTYRITVEDKRRGVDLVPLHRALLGLPGVRDMSLLSYNNGIAIVSLETVSDIDPEPLERAVARAMARDACVEVHNENHIVIKLGEE